MSNEITTPEAGALLPADPMIAMIERVVLDPNADIEKLEKMLAMRERLEDREAEKSFNEALSSAQADMPKILARHNNDQTKSKYAKLKDIYEECKPIMSKHGFSFNAVPVSGGSAGFISMQWTLRRGAHSEGGVSEIPIDDKGMKGSANKTQTHAYGSTTAYGRRYLFCAVMDIAVDDDKDGNATPKIATVSEDQFLALRKKLEESKMPPLKFHTAFGHKNPEVADLHQFPASQYQNAMDRLENYIAQKKAEAAK